MGTKSNGAVPDREDGPAWVEQPWYRVPAGSLLVMFDVGLALVLVAVAAAITMGEWEVTVLGRTLNHAGTVPSSIHVYTSLGALGYVFTRLIKDFDSTPVDIVHYNLRVPAAVVLGVGIYLFAVGVGGLDPEGVLLHGLLFLSGLFVNLTYKRLGKLADKYLPTGEGTTTDSEGDRSTEPATDDADTERTTAATDR